MKKTWTWKEIAELRKPDKMEERKQFLADYGDRGIVALMASGHKPGTWSPCPIPGYKEGCGCPDTCPLHLGNRFRRRAGRKTCSQASMAVYAKMVKVLGRKHQPRKAGRGGAR